jgi:hypothetical protein
MIIVNKITNVIVNTQQIAFFKLKKQSGVWRIICKTVTGHEEIISAADDKERSETDFKDQWIAMMTALYNGEKTYVFE